jgi:hypothetical protein
MYPPFLPQQNFYSFDLAKQYKFPYLLNNSIFHQRTGKGILGCAFQVIKDGTLCF